MVFAYFLFLLTNYRMDVSLKLLIVENHPMINNLN